MTLDQSDRASITAQLSSTIPFVKEILKVVDKVFMVGCGANALSELREVNP